MASLRLKVRFTGHRTKPIGGVRRAKTASGSHSPRNRDRAHIDGLANGGRILLLFGAASGDNAASEISLALPSLNLARRARRVGLIEAP